ncbi:GAF and ANTAR domain-containing protein [Actinocatenispora rupis]|uniref:ANTAR domain-containing protein n=1 Tax=Actinocatenispora rupis TaxID=519421 RepID=A0A8J3NCR1_9ACTN|nr:GAF and ANTAR domain-containing protein [Actinocatenispora rupis]GID14584.1 hypothetical protein Aru02nite_54730 [Actinocatenispora rupis]
MSGERRVRLRRVVAALLDARGGTGRATAVCDACVSVLSGTDAAAVSLRTPSGAETVLGASDDWAVSLEEMQYTVGEGPGLAAHESGRPVLVDDLGGEATRWPAFVDAAQAAGVRSVATFPLRMGGIRLGVLDLYGRHSGVPTGDAVADAVVLAELALSAVLDHVSRAEGRGEDWIAAANSYKEVNIATGIIAGRLGISLTDAFARLRAYAFAQERTLRAVAADVVARRTDLEESG